MTTAATAAPLTKRSGASRTAAPVRTAPATGVSGFPLPLPTRRGALLVAAAALITLLGGLAPVWGVAGLVLALIATVAVFADGWSTPRADAFVALRVGRPVVPLGTIDVIGLELRLRRETGAKSRRRSFAARVVDDLHPAISRDAEPDPFRITDDGTARVGTRVRALRRGDFELGAVHLRVVGRFGLSEREVRFDLPLRVRVLPGLGQIAEIARVLRQGARREAGRRRSRLRGHGTAFESLREYVRGDDPRHVDWKASARHRKLITRHFEVERSQRVMLMIDAGRWMTGEVDGLTRLDRVLNACMLLAHAAVLRDDRVGVVVFSDRVHRFVPPSKGRAAVERVLEAVYDVEPRLVESDYQGVFAHLSAKHRKRSLLVLFTDVLDRDQSRIVVAESMRSASRHLPLVVALRDTEIDTLASRVPTNAAAAYRQAAAEELLLDREAALATMKHAGVHVLDCAPELLASSVVDRYLELKARLLL